MILVTILSIVYSLILIQMCVLLYIYIQVPKEVKMGVGVSVAGKQGSCEPPDVGTVK